MKQTIRIQLLLCTFAMAAFRTNAQDWQTFGNTIMLTEWFGANPDSEVPVRFQHHAPIGAFSRFEWWTHNGTNVNERMRLTNIGFLGIGTSAPNNLLELHGSDKVNPWGIRINNTATGVGPTDGMYLGTMPAAGNTVEGRLNWLEPTSFHFLTNNITRMTLTGNNGWLGLNNTAPVAHLNVRGSNVFFEMDSMLVDSLYNPTLLDDGFFWISGRNALRFATAMNSMQLANTYANVGNG